MQTYVTKDVDERYSQVNQRADDLDTEWLKLVELGQNVIANREDTSWAIGDLACQIAHRWQRSKKTLIKFADEIGMANPRLIYEYHEVSEFWDKQNSARCELLTSCPTLNWSKFRAAYRGCKKRNQDNHKGAAYLKTCHDNLMSTEAFSEFLRKLPNTDGTPATNYFTLRQRVTCEVIDHYSKENEPFAKLVIKLSKEDCQTVLDKMDEREFISYLALRWEEERIDKQKASGTVQGG